MTNANTIRLPFLFYKRHGVKKPVHTLEPKPLSRAEQIATGIIELFETCGTNLCKDALIPQTAHMVQCAMLAMERLSDLPVIIGALLHDIGHLLRYEKGVATINDVEPLDYARTGAAYLRYSGFSERVCAIVEQQLTAQRYLVATDNIYRTKLSADKWQTLNAHGAYMTVEEADVFEKHPYFTDIINVCRWDEQAKKSNAALLPVAWFYRLIWDHLYLRVS